MADPAGRVHSAARARSGFYAALFVALCGLITLGATFAVFSRGASLVGLRLLLPGAVYFTFALVLTRNSVLAALVGLAPIAGATWSLALMSESGPTRTDLDLALALGSVVAFLCADEFEAQLASGSDLRIAAFAGLRVAWRSASGSLVPAAGALVLAVDGNWSVGTALVTTSWLLLPVLAALALVPAGAMLVVLDEPFLSRVNRAREWRTETAYPLTLVTIPRWGLSVSGVGLVALVLSYFGAEPVTGGGHWIAYAIALGSLPVSLVLTRDWRTTIGLGFSLSVISLMGLWAATLQNAGAHFDAVGFYGAVTIGFALMVGVAARGAPGRERSAVLARAVEKRAAVVICATTSVLVAELVTVQLSPAIAIVILASAICSLLLVTAISSALEVVVPRRKSIAELYARRS